MTKPATDEEFARAFAPLLEVQQNGRFVPATPNHVLELLGPPRYLLKGSAGYLADGGKGWTDRQREAIVIPDRDFADEACEMGLRKNGVTVKVVRLRRRGTRGLEAVRIRQGLELTEKDGLISFGIGADEAMAMLTALTGAKVDTEQQ